MHSPRWNAVVSKRVGYERLLIGLVLTEWVFVHMVREKLCMGG
jgi:hypothetical protein